MSAPTSFVHWCIVEVMGHQRYAGMVTETEIAGCGFIRVDVPPADERPGFSKLFGPKSIHSITPVSEEVAKLAAASIRSTPIEKWSIPDEWKRPAIEQVGDDDDEIGF